MTNPCIWHVAVLSDIFFQAASTAEEAPTENAAEESSEAGEDGAPEGMAETGGRGSGKKEAGSSKSTVDGKLVKGALPR